MESISESLPGDLQINDHDRENPQIHGERKTVKILYQK